MSGTVVIDRSLDYRQLTEWLETLTDALDDSATSNDRCELVIISAFAEWDIQVVFTGDILQKSPWGTSPSGGGGE